MKKIVMGLLAGLALLSCSSPTEPGPEVGLFLNGKVTSEWHQNEIEFERVVITVRCSTCEDAVARIRVREDGTYGARLPDPDRHQGHSVRAEAYYCEYEPRFNWYEDRMDWDSFPKTPVEWNPVLK